MATSAAALEARSAIALASARGEQTIEQANEYAKHVREESLRLTNAAHAASNSGSYISGSGNSRSYIPGKWQFWKLHYGQWQFPMLHSG